MTQSTGGITGLVGWVYTDPEATPEERYGGAADERHGIPGEQATPYPWEVLPGQPHGPYGLENGLLGANPNGLIDPAGQLGQDPTADLQPITHAAPWPKGVPMAVTPDGTAEWREQNRDIHGMGQGGSRDSLYSPTLDPVQDQWQLIAGQDAGSSLQDHDIPSQLKTTGSGGAGSTDRVSSMARQNGYGFDEAHQTRRYAEVGTGAFPGNFLWMQPGSRPLIKSIAGTSQPAVGADSPFTGQDTGQNFNAQGAVLTIPPAAYTPPVDPVTATGYPSTAPAPVSWY